MITGNNLITDRSDQSRDENENYFKKNHNFRLNLNFDKKFLCDQINDKSKMTMTANNITEGSNFEEKSVNISEDFVKNDNFEITLKRQFISGIFPHSARCEKCENSNAKIDELEKLLEQEKLLGNNLTNSIRKYEAENIDLNKYNILLVGEKSNLAITLKKMEKRINILAIMEKQFIDKENENNNLTKKLVELEELNNNLHEKISKYEDQTYLLNEYKIKLKMNQNENFIIKKDLNFIQNEFYKIKKDSEIYYNKIKINNKLKEIRTVEFFTIQRQMHKNLSKELVLTKNDKKNISKIIPIEGTNEVIRVDVNISLGEMDNFRKTSKNDDERMNYIENLNIYNDSKSKDGVKMKSFISQNNHMIEQMRKKIDDLINKIITKDNRIRNMEKELTLTIDLNKKRERMIKTLHKTLEENKNLLSTKHSFLKWTYYLITIILVCLMLNKFL